MLTDETVTIRNVPDITDVVKIVGVLRDDLGSRDIAWDRDAQTIDREPPRRRISIDRRQRPSAGNAQLG